MNNYDYTFAFVWCRDWVDDHNFIKALWTRGLSYTDAILKQIQMELESWGYRRERSIRFSRAIISEGDNYFCLAEVDCRHVSDDYQVVWQEFKQEFQSAFDDGDAAGLYELVAVKRSLIPISIPGVYLPNGYKSGSFITLDSGVKWPIPSWK